jgi:hypothetical protein
MSEPMTGTALRVIAGSPDPEEVAVVVAVLSAVASGTAPAEEPVRLSSWTDRARALRRRPAPGPTSWRDSGLPL